MDAPGRQKVPLGHGWYRNDGRATPGYSVRSYQSECWLSIHPEDLIERGLIRRCLGKHLGVGCIYSGAPGRESTVEGGVFVAMTR